MVFIDIHCSLIFMANFIDSFSVSFLTKRPVIAASFYNRSNITSREAFACLLLVCKKARAFKMTNRKGSNFYHYFVVFSKWVLQRYPSCVFRQARSGMDCCIIQFSNKKRPLL